MWSSWQAQSTASNRQLFPAAGAEDPARPRSSPRRPLSGGTKAAVAYDESWVRLGLGAGLGCSSRCCGSISILFQSKFMKFILFITKKLHSNMLRLCEVFIVHQCPIQHVMSPSVFWFWCILTINLNLCAITFGICRGRIQPALCVNECDML